MIKSYFLTGTVKLLQIRISHDTSIKSKQNCVAVNKNPSIS
jgi:hypothetical protein